MHVECGLESLAVSALSVHNKVLFDWQSVDILMPRLIFYSIHKIRCEQRVWTSFVIETDAI